MKGVVMTNTEQPVLDFRVRPAWEAGFGGEPCPAPPSWMEASERAAWKAAHGRGRQTAGLGPLPRAVVFSAGYKHWRVAAAVSHKVTLGSWKTPRGAERAAVRAGFNPTLHDDLTTAGEAIRRLKADR